MARRRRGGAAESDFFPGFTDISEIGLGSLATVYRAREIATNRFVALKLLNVRDASPRAIESFERESIALGALSSHPNIVTLYRMFRSADDRPVLVLELCRGSIGDRLIGGGLLPVQEVVALGIKIAGALETAHRAGILHRDVKPQNILVTEYGEPALSDFGVAMLQSSTQTTAGLFDFTTLHAAPELLEGKATSAATDVYELASSLYQLLAGQSAFRAYEGESPASVILRILRDPVRPVMTAGVPNELSDLLIKAMSKNKDQRPPTAAEFAAALGEIETSQGWLRTQFPVRGPEHAMGPAVGPAVAPPPPTYRAPAGPPVAGPMMPGPIVPAAPIPPAVPVPRAAPVAPVAPVALPTVPRPVAQPAAASYPAAPPPSAAQRTAPPEAPPDQTQHMVPKPAPARPVRPVEPSRATPARPAPQPAQPAPPSALPDRTQRAVPKQLPPADPPRATSAPAPAAASRPTAPESAPAPPAPVSRAVPENTMPTSRFAPHPDAGPMSHTPRPAAAAPPPPHAPPPLPPPPPAPAPPPPPPLPSAPPAANPPVVAGVPEIPDRTMPRAMFPIPPAAGRESPVEQDVPVWNQRTPTPAVDAMPSVDPSTLRRKFTVRGNRAAVSADDRFLIHRQGFSRTKIPWQQVTGFEPVIDPTGGRGTLIAMTLAGRVPLPATTAPVSNLRYVHAMLDAYLRRATQH